MSRPAAGVRAPSSCVEPRGATRDAVRRPQVGAPMFPNVACDFGLDHVAC